MEYLVKRYLIYKELRKPSQGFFNFDLEHHRNRARFLNEMRNIYLQIQARGISYGLSLGIFTFYNYSLRQTLAQRLFLVVLFKEVVLFHYVDDFYAVLIGPTQISN